MSSADQELLSAFDGQDVESVRAALEGGANADWGCVVARAIRVTGGQDVATGLRGLSQSTRRAIVITF